MVRRVLVDTQQYSYTEIISVVFEIAYVNRPAKIGPHHAAAHILGLQ